MTINDNSSPDTAADLAPAVHVGQVGYLPNARKFAMLTHSPQSDVVVRDETDGVAVFAARASEPVRDVDTGEMLSLFDFSALTRTGSYRIHAPGVGESDLFRIDSDVFAPAFRLAMRGFYAQRCGMDVDLSPDFPQYRYRACHLGAARFHASSGRAGLRDMTGGWHDAGDYGRYVVNSGLSTATLLWAFEMYRPALGGICLDIPESGCGLPDMLSEIRYNIEWMSAMQDEVDGGVWHKATSANFCGFIMPHDDLMPVLVIGSGTEPYKTTGATADFASVLAIAARVYRPFDAAFSAACLDAARRAWGWLCAHPEDHEFTNPEGIKTGGYGDGDLRDERLWAAAELFRTTGDPECERYFREHYRQWDPPIDPNSAPAWGRVTLPAMFAYMLAEQTSADPAVVAHLRDSTIRAADALVARAEANGYRTPMRASDYIWGSNSVVANYAMVLLIADSLSPSAGYRETALDCLHYLFGRNTFGISFVTHAGTRWAMNPHHRPSAADGIAQPWPGLLVGGPNANRCSPPARQWSDEVGRYDLNEIAINWNAPLVFALAAFVGRAEHGR